MTTSHFAVLTAQKQTGSGGGLSAHIDRQRWDNEQKALVPYQPKSVTDAERTKLNQEYIMPPGMSRTEAIEQRIKEAKITRKIKDGAVKAICFICTSDHDKMKEIEKSGRIHDWAHDCIDYIRKTFGQENVVAAALHMDETTPHLHVTVVPIVEGQAKERKKRPKLDENGNPIEQPPKRSIKKQQVTARLCAKEIMTPTNMSRWQNEFAQVMDKWGMIRGIEGSPSEHQDPKEYNKKERAKEKILGIIGKDKRSKQFREAYNELKKCHDEEKNALKGQISALQRDLREERENHKADNAKAAQNEQNLYGTIAVKNCDIYNKDEQLKKKEGIINKLEAIIEKVARSLPGADKAMEAVQWCCRIRNDGTPVKSPSEAREDIMAALSPINDKTAQRTIIGEWWRMATKNPAQFAKKEKYLQIKNDLLKLPDQEHTFSADHPNERHENKRENKKGLGI